MQHIAYGMLWMEKNYVLGEQSDWNPPAVAGRKKETVAYINSAFDSLEKVIGNAKDLSEEKVNAFFSVLEHTAHHRGQGTTYLRYFNVTPPEYPF